MLSEECSTIEENISRHQQVLSLSPFGHPDGRAQGQGLDFNGGKLEKKEQAEKEAQLSALKK